MRREDYERTYGRRMPPPPMHPSSREGGRRSDSGRGYKMKCLISIGLILPALAAVIGVAAWAVSADVVMNSGNRNGNSGRGDNSLLQQGYSSVENDNRPDIFRMNSDNQRLEARQPSSTTTTTSTTTSTTTTTTTTSTTTTPKPTTSTTTTTTPAPQTLSPKEATDVNAILSKLISASGAASGGNGPRFVVVAPLPENSEVLQPAISRVDQTSASKERSNPLTSSVDQPKERPKDELWHVDEDKDLLVQSSSVHPRQVALPPPRNVTNGRTPSSNRRMSDKSGIHRSGYHHHTIELTGFDPFDSMMQESLAANPSAQVPHSFVPPPPNFKRGPPPGGHFGTFQHSEKHVFNPHEGVHAFKVNQGPPLAVGMKPIQQQLHHVDPGHLQTAESGRWGTIGFPPGPSYHHKPPEGISLSISSPANSGTHVSAAEPVNVIKSFFLPFLPRPKLNMNARVVFGVVLDKGMGIGANKKEGHHMG